MPKRADPGQGALFSPGARPTARLRRAVDAQLSAQRRLGQLEDVDAGLIGAARTLADLADAEVVDREGSRFTAGKITRDLVAVLGMLRGDRLDAATGDGLDAELAALVAAVRDAAGRDTPDDR